MYVARKEFPHGYPNDALQVIEAMSLTKGKNTNIVGSMALRSQIYAGDYDCYENVEGTLSSHVSKFKRAIKNILDIPNTYISDIKSGSIEEWKIIDDEYDYTKSKEKLETLYKQKIINEDLYKLGKKKIKPTISKLEHLMLKRDLRPNIIRWKTWEALRGYKIVHNKKFTLEQAFQTPTITKVDVISWVQNNRFTDFSMIYEFHHNGKIFNPSVKEFENSILENIFVLYHEGKFFKMAKRMFSLARFKKDNDAIKRLSELFNRDLGRIYMVYGDLGTIEWLFENIESIPLNKIEFELNQFKARLSNVSLESYLSKEDHIFKLLDKLYNERTSKEYTLKTITEIKDILEVLLNYHARLYLQRVKMFPDF